MLFLTVFEKPVLSTALISYCIDLSIHLSIHLSTSSSSSHPPLICLEILTLLTLLCESIIAIFATGHLKITLTVSLTNIYTSYFLNTCIAYIMYTEANHKTKSKVLLLGIKSTILIYKCMMWFIFVENLK